jgi:glycerate dehydrogenase
MKIVVLDGYTLNPGDLSWEQLRSLGNCEIHDRTPPAQVAARAQGAEVVLTNKTVLSAEILGQLSELRYVGVLATGYNVVDLPAAKKRGIVVTNVPTYGTGSVAQMTLALLLELTQHVGHHAQTVREGRWSASPDFCYWDHPLVELEGLTMGIIGYGRIGRTVGDLAVAFGMNVLVHDITRPPQLLSPIQWAELEALLRQSDAVSLHCPLTPQTQGLINRERLAWMKPTAYLLNTSRGPLVDAPALANALDTGRLAGAGLDVLAIEPPPRENPLLRARNCLITPHIAWATQAARARLLETAVQNVRAFLAGQAKNVVNP